MLQKDTSVLKDIAAYIFRHHSSEDLNLNLHCHENLKLHNFVEVFRLSQQFVDNFSFSADDDTMLWWASFLMFFIFWPSPFSGLSD
jgi:hypothetical protein